MEKTEKLYKRIIDELIQNGRIYSVSSKKIPAKITYQQEVIDVHGTVNLYSMRLDKIPVPFGHVSGSFDVRSNNLKNLINGPVTVLGDYRATDNELISLKGHPIKCRNFIVSLNKLKKLNIDNLTCHQLIATHNQLKSLNLQKVICKELNLSNNSITNLIGSPKNVSILILDANPLESFIGISKNIEKIFCRLNQASLNPEELLRCMKLNQYNVYLNHINQQKYIELYNEPIEFIEFN